MVKEDQEALESLQTKLNKLNGEIQSLQITLNTKRKEYLKVEDDVIFAKVQRDQLTKQLEAIRARNDFASAEDDARTLEIQRLERNLDGLLDKLKHEPQIDVLRVGDAGTQNPVKQFLDKNPQVAEKFKGMKVAFDTQKGSIVASGQTLGEVYDQVDQKGLLNMVSFITVE